VHTDDRVRDVGEIQIVNAILEANAIRRYCAPYFLLHISAHVDLKKKKLTHLRTLSHTHGKWENARNRLTVIGCVYLTAIRSVREITLSLSDALSVCKRMHPRWVGVTHSPLSLSVSVSFLLSLDWSLSLALFVTVCTSVCVAGWFSVWQRQTD
jgi:hypothetical protein